MNNEIPLEVHEKAAELARRLLRHGEANHTKNMELQPEMKTSDAERYGYVCPEW